MDRTNFRLFSDDLDRTCFGKKIVDRTDFEQRTPHQMYSKWLFVKNSKSNFFLYFRTCNAKIQKEKVIKGGLGCWLLLMKNCMFQRLTCVSFEFLLCRFENTKKIRFRIFYKKTFTLHLVRGSFRIRNLSEMLSRVYLKYFLATHNCPCRILL